MNASVARREPGGQWGAALGLFAVAAVVRCTYVALVADDPSLRFPIGDSLAYHKAALAIAGGDWLGDEVFYQDPLYPYLLAGLYAVFGIGSLGVLVAQALLDSISVVLIYATAKTLFGPRSAVLAGLLAVLYRPFWFYDAILLKVPLSLLLAAATGYALVRADVGKSGRWWLAAGFALGLAALTRGNYLVFVPVLLGWLALAPGVAALGTAARVRFIAAVAAGLALAIGPVAVRNYAVAEDFVLITSQAGQNFYIGNYRGNDSGTYKAPPFVIANAAHEQQDFRDEGQRRAGRAMKPSELSRFWFDEAFREIRAEPSHFAAHTLRKLRLFFNYYEIPDNHSFAFFRQHVSSLLAIPTPDYGVLLPLAVCGVFFARRQRGAWLLFLFFASYAASVVLFFNVSRYRIPAIPVVLVFAGYALSEGWERLKRREWRAAVVPVLLFGLGLAVTQARLIQEDFALYRSNFGTAHARQADEHYAQSLAAARAGDANAAVAQRDSANALWDAAEQQFRRALDTRGRDPRLRSALKGLLVTRIEKERDAGRIDAALELVERLTATFPRYSVGFTIRGELYEQQGDLERAARSLGHALAVSPGDQRAKAALVRVRSALSSAKTPEEAL